MVGAVAGGADISFAENGGVDIKFDQSFGALQGNDIKLVPHADGKELYWTCTDGSLAAKYRPAALRGEVCLMARSKRRDRLLLCGYQRVTHRTQGRLPALHAAQGGGPACGA